MTFKDTVEADNSIYLNADEFADAVTIGGSSVAAVIDYDESPAAPPAGDGFVDWATVYVSVEDLAAPSYRLAITIGSTTWYVSTWSGVGGMWQLRCYANERPFRRF